MMATFTIICILLACAALPILSNNRAVLIKFPSVTALAVPVLVLISWLFVKAGMSPIFYLSPLILLITMHQFYQHKVPAVSLAVLPGNQQQSAGIPVYAFKQIDTDYREKEKGIALPAPLSRNQEEQLKDLLPEVIIAQMLFLRHRYTIGMLSQATGVQIHHLSAFINKKYGMNFNDFINEYRIKYCIGKFQNQEWRNKTLEALAEESGFNNRNSFTNAFKKFVGITPSSYLKQSRCEIVA